MKSVQLRKGPSFNGCQPVFLRWELHCGRPQFDAKEKIPTTSHLMGSVLQMKHQLTWFG